MPPNVSGSAHPHHVQHAITDLFDEQRGTFLFQYPIVVVLALSLSGVLAFAVTGFLGYQDAAEPSFSRVVFQQAWMLFLWFCALVLTLQISIFRDVSLRKRLIATIIVSVVAIIVVGIIYFNRSLPYILQQLLQGHRLITFLARNAWTYTVVNFLILGVFWVDTLRRWLRRARGQAPTPSVNIGGGEQPRAQELPSMQELVSGDLIAGAVLALLLAGLFWHGLLAGVIQPQGVPISECTISWPIGFCHAGGTLADAPTLTFIDLIQSLVYLPLGLLVLAISATLSGFGAVEGVADKLAPELHTAQLGTERAGAVPIAEDVATTVLNTLRSALDRRLRLLASNLALSLRNVAWPALIFVAVFGLAELATDIQLYLHSPKAFADVAQYVLPAAVWGLGAVLSVVFSAALMLFRWHVAENTLRFLGLIGFIVLLTFWIFSLALWGFNELLLLTHATARHPFDPPSFTTTVSFAALLLFGVALVARRVHHGGASRAPALVGAATRSGDPEATGVLPAPRAPES